MIVCSFCLFFLSVCHERLRGGSRVQQWVTINPIDCVSVVSCDLNNRWVRPLTFFFSYWPIRLCWVLANSLYVVHNIIYNEKKGNWLIKSWCLISILECFLSFDKGSLQCASILAIEHPKEWLLLLLWFFAINIWFPWVHPTLPRMNK